MHSTPPPSTFSTNLTKLGDEGSRSEGTKLIQIFIKDLLTYFHASSIGGHSGECLVCQKCKPGLSAYLGLLRPLPIPKTVWTSISMDFIEGLPKSHGCTVIFVVTDGQTKVVNRCLVGYLRFITGEHPKEWFKWIPLAELWYNLNYHSAIDTTPFEALYGQPPLVYVPYVGGLSKVDSVDRSLIAREQAIEVMKFHLSRAQNRMKQQVDKNRSKRDFEVGSWVLLKLQPHRQVSIRQGKQNKFSSKYFGPFQVLAKVGSVAYKLKLPVESHIHDVFHVSQLKKVHGDHHLNVPIVLPHVNKEGLLEVSPKQVLDRKIAKKNNVVAVYGLI
ncbi:retrotransposable element Tf2 [Tanacetum coccineum]